MNSNHPKLRYFNDFVIKKDPKDDYRLLKNIGSGTYGEVYKAENRVSKVLAAIKVVKVDIKDDVKAIAQEIHTLRECKHSNIVEYFGSYLRKNKLWICMEFCGGFSMQDIYTNIRRPLDENCIGFVTRETLRGLSYMHQQGKIHRDIKGANILLTEDGQVKIADFGVAAQITETIQKRSSFIGTPYWMAPEVAAVERKGGYDEKCDIWAVGITAIEYAELQPPMFDLHPMKALHILSMRNYKPPILQNKHRWTSKFHTFLKQCLNKNEKRRPNADIMLKHEFVSSRHLSIVLTKSLLQLNRNPGQKPLVPNEEDDDDEEMKVDDKLQAEKIKSTRRPGKHACLEDVRFKIPEVSAAPICEPEGIQTLQPLQITVTNNNNINNNDDQIENANNDEYENQLMYPAPLSPISVKNEKAEAFHAYNDDNGDEKSSEIVYNLVTNNQRLRFANKYVWLTGGDSHSSIDNQPPPTPPPKRNSSMMPPPLPPLPTSMVHKLISKPNDQYSTKPIQSNQVNSINNGTTNTNNNNSTTKQHILRRNSSADLSEVNSMVNDNNATESTRRFSSTEDPSTTFNIRPPPPVPPHPYQNASEPPPVPLNKPRPQIQFQPQTQPQTSDLTITSTSSSSSSSNNSDHQTGGKNTKHTKKNKTDNSSSPSNTSKTQSDETKTLLDLNRRKAIGLGLPPTPKVPMGACFSLIFEGCPLKINSTATWIHPITNTQIILFGANEGIYFLSLDELADSSLTLLFPRRCLWLYVVRGTMMSLSGQHPQLYNHNLVLLFKLKQHNQSLNSDKFNFSRLLPRRFLPTTKVPDTKGCQAVNVTRNPYSGAKYLCAALPNHLLVMEWFSPVNTFMEVKRVAIHSMPQPILNFDLLVFHNKSLPLVCLGVHSSPHSSTSYQFHLIDLNNQLNLQQEPQQHPLQGQIHGIDDIDNSTAIDCSSPFDVADSLIVNKVVQLEFKTVLIALQDKVIVTNLKGQLKSSRNKPSVLDFESGVTSIICLSDSILAFHNHGFCGKNFNGQLTQEINDSSSIYRLIGSDKNIVVEKRSVEEPMEDSNIYILAGHTDSS